MWQGFLASWHTAPPYAAWPPTLVGACTAALGLTVLIRERGRRVSRAFFFLTGSAALWLLSFNRIYACTDVAGALLWARFETIAVVLIPIALFYFTLIVVKQADRLRWSLRAAALMSFGLTWAAACSSRFVHSVRFYPWGAYPQYGWIGTV